MIYSFRTGPTCYCCLQVGLCASNNPAPTLHAEQQPLCLDTLFAVCCAAAVHVHHASCSAHLAVGEQGLPDHCLGIAQLLVAPPQQDWGSPANVCRNRAACQQMLSVAGSDSKIQALGRVQSSCILMLHDCTAQTGLVVVSSCGSQIHQDALPGCACNVALHAYHRIKNLSPDQQPIL